MKLTDIKGIGPKKSQALAKLDIYKASDLYNYYPRAYEDRRSKTSIKNAVPNKATYFEWTVISKPYTKRLKNLTMTYMYFSEGDFRKIRVIWFNDRFSYRQLELGKTYKFYTKVFYKKGYYEAVNPIFEGIDGKNIGKIVSIYPLTSGVSQKDLSKFIKEALKNFDEDEEILEKDLAKEFDLLERKKALASVHFPKDLESLYKAKSDIKILDLLKELVFLHFINEFSKSYQDTKLTYDLEKILAELDFSLTRGQLRSLKEILEDSNSKVSMNRLLVGDVGSGKTIVAIISMIVFSQNSYQAAMMVPTEVLAIQQYKKNLGLFKKFGIRAALLTGSTKDKDRIKEGLKDGSIDVVIGTHALIEDDVIFSDLRLVVNDEQHRFGVRQRQAIAKKSESINYLTMTATPIPRTLSLRINKMLDLSIIDSLPKGRIGIDSKIVFQNREKILFEDIRSRLEDGRQAYIVTNNIDSDDINSVENLYKRISKYFKNFRVEKLHGKLKSDTKEKILDDFSKGKIHILISTTVIEVGIDVANANMMAIYNAENFGLSQLHQLRGRVGRGEYKSYCYLISKNDKVNKKLKIVESTSDGFKIAQKDYDLRGGGKILSLIQHGKNLSEMEYLNMTKEETDRAFDIFESLEARDFKSVNLNFVRKFFKEDKEIILN